MKKNVLLIIVGVVVIGLAAGAYFMFFNEPPKGLQAYYYTPGEYFVTNVSDSDMLLKVMVVLGSDADHTEFFESHVLLIRNEILFQLRSMAEDQFKDSQMETNFSDVMTQKLNTALDVDYITRIYISDLVLQ